MKVKTLQIVWHEKEPVYSLDFHPDGTLFTAGADKQIKTWEVSGNMEKSPVLLKFFSFAELLIFAFE